MNLMTLVLIKLKLITRATVLTKTNFFCKTKYFGLFNSETDL